MRDGIVGIGRRHVVFAFFAMNDIAGIYRISCRDACADPV
jgi:hypothetical protein